MAKKKNISAVISLKDNMSASLRGIRREQKVFQQEVRQTKKAMDSAFKKEMNARLNATKAHKEIQKLRKSAKYLEKRKIVIDAIAKTQRAMDKINKVKSNLKSLGKTIAKPVIMAKDKATAVLGKVKSVLGGLAKGLAIPVTIAMAGAGGLLKSGMELEKQQVSMNHFMGVGNAGKSEAEIKKMSDQYLKDLRSNASATPFETGEVIAAGTRALQIAGGSSKEAMGLVKLAEDMAAMNNGKTVGDAMEALADMQMGKDFAPSYSDVA